MTTSALLFRRARALHLFQDARPQSPHRPRMFSSSVAVSKKKRAAHYDDNDLFGSSQDGNDLFGGDPAAKNSSSEPIEPEIGSSSNRKPFAEEFTEQFSFVTTSIASTTGHSYPLVRQRALRRLLHVSQGKEDLEKVISLLIPWRNSGRPIDRDTALELIDRCLAWEPSLILKVMSERSKNGFVIPNVAEARRILHKLVFHRPSDVAQSSEREVKRQGNADAVRNAATFAALMPACGLKAVEDDLICCALLAQACARNLLSSATPVVNGKAVASHVPDAQASMAGLKDLSKKLSATLSKPSQRLAKKLPLPSSDLITKWIGSYREAGVKDPRARLNPLIFEDRASGVTQSGIVERVWLLEAIKDVAQAAKLVDGVNIINKDVTVLERIIGESQHTDESAFTLPKPWMFDKRAQKWALPAGLEAS